MVKDIWNTDALIGAKNKLLERSSTSKWDIVERKKGRVEVRSVIRIRQFFIKLKGGIQNPVKHQWWSLFV